MSGCKVRASLSQAAGDVKVTNAMVAARGETPAAFGRRCIPSGCVAPRSNTPGILARRALPAGRIAALGATLDFHHGLLVWIAQNARDSLGRPVHDGNCARIVHARRTDHAHGPDPGAIVVR